jgi:hypothetical protein
MRILTTALLALMISACAEPPAEITVTVLQVPTASGSMAPSLTRHPGGDLVLDWMEPAGDGYALRYARSSGGTWTSASTIASGTDWFVNWADFPSVSIAANGRWTAHWLQMEDVGTYSYGIRVVGSSDDGRSWDAPVTPHRDGTPTEHGFVSHYNTEAGVGLIWLDGRETLAPEAPVDGDSGEDGVSGMTLRHAILSDDGMLTDELQLDGLTCDCCQTDVAMTPDGPIVAYRDRTEAEIRDIYVVRHTADGWTEPVAVHNDDWEMAACPVNGPAIATRGDDVVVAWYTAAGGQGRVKIARSSDSGVTFDAPMMVDETMPLGRLDLVALGQDAWVVAWFGRDAAGPALLMRRLDADGLGPVESITPISEARRSGFPRMVADGDAVVVAWTAVDGDTPKVNAARVEGFLN